MEEKKDEKKQNLQIIILSIIIVILLVALIYALFFKKKEELKTVDNPPVTEKENNEEEQENKIETAKTAILDKIKKYGLTGLMYNMSRASQITFDETPLNEQMELIYYHYGKDLTKNNVTSYYKDVYGVSIKDYNDIICSNDKKAYCKYANDEYNCNPNDHPHGLLGEGYYGFELDYYVANAEVVQNAYNINGDSYIIDLLVLSGSKDFGYRVNNEYNLADSVTDNNSAISYFRSHINSYTHKYRYVFEKVNGEYYLKGFSIIPEEEYIPEIYH